MERLKRTPFGVIHKLVQCSAVDLNRVALAEGSVCCDEAETWLPKDMPGQHSNL